MTKTSPLPLKVFAATIGFFETVVAASSQAAALRLWGTHQNLFTSGDARQATDPMAIAAAREQPGKLLRRALGSQAPFAIEPVSPPELPDAPKRSKAKTSARASAPKPQPDRSGLNRAEASLQDLDARRKLEEAAFQHDAENLERRRNAARAAYIEARAKARKSVDTARSNFLKAGGKA